jgi:hypothetical protein
MNLNFSKTTAKSAEIELITPQIAEAYLKTSNGNRSLKRTKIEALLADMKAGNFTFNGESIIFSKNNVLMDGHHRLTSVARSGVSIWSVVVRGVDNLDGKTIDTGASRTVGDHLSFEGFKNTNLITSVTRLLISLRLGRPKSANPSTTEVFEFIEQHPEILPAVESISTRTFPRTGSILGAIKFVAARNGEEHLADAFYEVFNSGVPAYVGCPAHLLRERISREALTGRATALIEFQRLVISAWEKFRVGETARRLQPSTNFRLKGWS